MEEDTVEGPEPLGRLRQPRHSDLAASWHGLGRGWLTYKVELLSLPGATEEAEGTGLWSALVMTPRWLSVPGVASQLPFSVFREELMSVEPSLLTHMASRTVPFRLGYIHSI